MNTFVEVVAANCPPSGHYEDSSFRGTLHETSAWDDTKYWHLEQAIYELAAQGFAREIASMLFAIYSDTAMLLSAHLDPNDVGRIRNKTDEEVHDLRERITLVVGGYFNGQMPDQRLFAATNPRLSHARG